METSYLLARVEWVKINYVECIVMIIIHLKGNPVRIWNSLFYCEADDGLENHSG